MAAVADEHVVYVSTIHQAPAMMMLYLAATCVVSLFSSHRLVQIFGVLTLLLFFVAYRLYTEAPFSVWCFISAVLSSVIYLYFSSSINALALLQQESDA